MKYHVVSHNRNFHILFIRIKHHFKQHEYTAAAENVLVAAEISKGRYMV
ncbi:MAG: hypothetical protein IJI14_17610 [Anaerolineaceae bacterium]|nr:hypothetical protein [Anaerolineaceae bacterium]